MFNEKLILEALQDALVNRCGVRHGDRLLIGVSGGMDSMVLWWGLGTLSLELKLDCAVAHANHGLRGRCSDGDEALVLGWAKWLGFPVFVEHLEVSKVARERGISLEMAGRVLRHAWLESVALRGGFNHVVLAHHLDDQEELFFLRVLRGAGGRGLGGMRWCRPGLGEGRGLKVIRPLLGMRKADLAALGRVWGVPFRDDSSNQDETFPRNWLRGHWLPALRNRWGKGALGGVSRVMDVLGAQQDFIEGIAGEYLRDGAGQEFASLHVAVQREIIRLEGRRVGVELSFDWVERLRLGKPGIWMLKPDLRVKWDPAAGRLVEVSGGKGGGIEEAVFLDGELEFPVEVEGSQGSGDWSGLIFAWERGNETNEERSEWAGQESFDARKVGRRIVLRHWRRGDRFEPIGLGVEVKLQDWFVNRKVPRHERHQRVLGVAEDGGIFWVEGERIGERYRLVDGTRERFFWKWTRLEACE